MFSSIITVWIITDLIVIAFEAPQDGEYSLKNKRNLCQKLINLFNNREIIVQPSNPVWEGRKKLNCFWEEEEQIRKIISNSRPQHSFVKISS